MAAPSHGMLARCTSALSLLRIATVGAGLSGCAAPVGEPAMAAWMRGTPPTERTVLAPGVISRPDVHEFGCWTSADGRELFFGVERGETAEILTSRFAADGWSEPEVVLTHERYRYHDPCLSADGQRLYFISDRPADGVGEPKDSDLWYVQREECGWSEPVRLPETVNSPRNDYYASFTHQGHLYFARDVGPGPRERSNYDLFRAPWSGEDFLQAEPLPGAVNTGAYEADVFVAPDESWLIVCSTRRSGYGRGDLYASVRDEHGHWSPVRNLGPEVNTEGHELCPFVTADGRWLVYTSQEDIVVVGTEGLGLPLRR